MVSEEKSFEIVDGRTMETAYTISSSRAFGSGELKTLVRILLFVNDLPRTALSNAKLFADDSKVYRETPTSPSKNVICYSLT